MKLAPAWRQASDKLASQGIEDATLEAELLLRHILKMRRAELYAHLADDITATQVLSLNQLLGRRLRHEPSAYIRRSREFYGLDFYVDGRVLIPRPETELLVELALELARSYFPSEVLIADIGTGSGAIAVALAVNLPQCIGATIYATDISPQALEVAEINCRRHGVADRVHRLCGDLLTPLPQPVDIIVTNLPYVPEADWEDLPPEISRYEPRLALAGGADGLDCIRRFLRQVPGYLRPGGSFLLEVGIGQGQAVLEMAQNIFPSASVEIIPDLAGIPRVVVAQSPTTHFPRQAPPPKSGSSAVLTRN